MLEHGSVLHCFSMTEYHSMIWIDPVLFIHPSVVGHLGCFCLLAVVNNAAIAFLVFGCCNLGMVH